MQDIFFKNNADLEKFYELYAIEEHASPNKIEKAFTYEVADSHIFILLLNKELRPAVKLEFEAARKNNLRIFAYIKNTDNSTEELKEFISSEIYKNVHSGTFYDAFELSEKIQNDLHEDLIKTYSRQYKSINETKVISLPSADSQYRYYPIDQIIESSKSEELVDTDIDQLHSLAYMLLEKGSYRNALLLFEIILYRNSTDWQAYHNRGLILLEMGLTQNALFSFKKAIQFNPESHATYYSIGNIYYDFSRYEDALFNYLKALEIFPEKEMAAQRIINCYINLHQIDEALSWAEYAIKIMPTDNNFANLSIVLSLQENYSEALKNLENVTEGSYLYHSIKSLLLFKQENWRDSFNEIEKAGKINELNYELSIRKLSCLINLEELTELFNFLPKVEDGFPITAYDYHGIGHQLYFNFNLTHKAQELYRKAIEQDLYYMPAWNSLQFLLANTEEYEEGLEACNKALLINPYDPISNTNKMNFLMRLGRIGEFYEFIIKMISHSFGVETSMDKVEIERHAMEAIRQHPGFENIDNLEQFEKMLIEEQNKNKKL